MNFNNTLFTIIYVISCIIQVILYCYFLQNYLVAKHKYMSFIASCLIILFLSYIILNYAYENLPLKLLITITSIEFVSFLFYRGSLSKKISAAFLIFIANSLADFMSQFIIIFIFQYSIFNSLPPDILIFILIFANLLIIVQYKFILHYFKTSFSITSSYSKLFTAITLNIFLIMIILSESFYFNNLLSISPSQDILPLCIITCFICFIVALFIIYYTYRCIQSLKISITKETIYQAIHNEYMVQLEQYLDHKKNDDTLKHLRHDIMNYIQTIITKNQQEEQKHV